MYPCLLSSKPTRNTTVLYSTIGDVVDTPEVNEFVIFSTPFSLLVVNKKSIVLNSLGFHLKDEFHVCL